MKKFETESGTLSAGSDPLVISELTCIFIAVTWLAGIVLAKGGWATLAACLVPFYAWYLVVERAMTSMGVV